MVTNNKGLKVLLIPDLIIFIWGMLVGFDFYLYRKFVVEKYTLTSFLFLIVVIIFFNLFYTLSYFFTKKASVFIKCVALILTLVVLFWCAIVLVGFSIGGNFWKSETNDFDEFTRADPSLNDRLDFLGGNIDDIIALEIQNVEDFHYYYQSVLLVDSFEFRGRFVFSEESYQVLKNKFIQAPEFYIASSTSSDDGASSITGCFEWNDEIPSYERTTNVSSWDKVVIQFSDLDNSFYFDLIGDCYT